ncbi:MAG TPA: DUF2958 domain-containing protein [Pseudorhizobium sp.]|nr:DUF2958 domain-containing protein [Pseudorhizobium sp.]
MTELHLGPERLCKAKRSGTFLSLRYEIDGRGYRRECCSPLSWRALILFALAEGKTVTVHEIDLPGRYSQLFPRTLCGRMNWHIRYKADFPPVAKLHDPDGSGVMLLTRSRANGHAVDALHNLNEGGPAFQVLWIADIMALRPMLGIELVRDETFSTTLPISAFLDAAATKGRVVDEPELSRSRLTCNTARLPVPPASKAAHAIFNQAFRDDPNLQILRGNTIYDDYALPGSPTTVAGEASRAPAR